jgi:hypothetical protein
MNISQINEPRNTEPRKNIHIPTNLILNIPINEPRYQNEYQDPQFDKPESSNARNQTHTQKNIPRSFFYDENVMNEGISACNHSIISKIITDKPIHINSIQNGL